MISSQVNDLFFVLKYLDLKLNRWNLLILNLIQKNSGKTWMDKVAELREELKAFEVDAMMVTALDEIAWLLNIRGRDIPKSPFVISYLIVSHEEIHFYVDKGKINQDVQEHLRTKPGGNPLSVT